MRRPQAPSLAAPSPVGPPFARRSRPIRSGLTGPVWGGTLLSLTAAFTACHTRETLEAEHQDDLETADQEPLRVIDYLPGPGVPGVPKNMQPYFFFNRAIEDVAELALAVGSLKGSQYGYTPVVDFDDAGVVYVPTITLSSISGYEDYHMTLEHMPLENSDTPPLVDDSPFTTAFPPGLLFNMSTELECTQFGGSAVQAASLNVSFDPGVYPLWIMLARDLTAGTSFPFTTDLLMGPGYIRSSGDYRIYRQVGLATVFHDVTIDADGHFEATLEGGFMPLDTPETVVLTYMVDVRLEGDFDLSTSPARIFNLRMGGIFPARSLLLLANASESYAASVDMLELDVDLNGNGTNDAATFAAESAPAEIPPEQWDP